MIDDRFSRLWQQELDRRRCAGQLRERRVISSIDSTHVDVGGVVLVNFCSNDYLGLTHHPAVGAALAQAALAQGVGAGASPLVTGHTQQHAAAERAIARWKGVEAAVLLPSGYQTAHAVIQTLASTRAFHAAGVRFLVDKLAHASLIDAIVASQSPYRIFPHNQLGKVKRLLDEAPAEQLQVVVTESIFSMDGDAADLAGLARLKQTHPFLLVLDEAHGSGVYGPNGAGYAAECGLGQVVDVSIVTLSKALGLAGGAACGSEVFCRALVNWGRAAIYSTAVSPAMAAGIEAAIGVLRKEPQRQARVRELAVRLRGKVLKGRESAGPVDSPIVPVVLGSAERALGAAETLFKQGFLVVAIRPPTVPPGTDRLRITLSCEHSDEEVERLGEAVAAL